MISHGDEQVEEPVSNHGSAQAAVAMEKNAASTHSNPPASISICMVPLLLNVPLLRMIKAR